MKTILLMCIMGILFAGYSVATEAINTVNNIKTNQSYQLSLLK